MSNLATLETAPPFTHENAREMAMRSVEVRRNKIKARLQLSERPKIEPEIHRIVKAMSKLSVTSDDYVRLSGILERLWNKAFPTQGAARPSKRERAPVAQPLPEPAQAPSPASPEPQS